jgi:hypothetical protein
LVAVVLSLAVVSEVFLASLLAFLLRELLLSSFLAAGPGSLRSQASASAAVFLQRFGSLYRTRPLCRFRSAEGS